LEGTTVKSECNDFQEKIAALFLGDLSDGEKQALEEHFAECSHCRSERDSYARTVQQLASAGDEAIPHHFFIHSELQSANPWQLFRQMHWRWQAAFTCVAVLILLPGIAAISRVQIRSNTDGWAIGFGSNDIDSVSLKKEILAAVEKKNQEAKAAWIQEVRSELINRQMEYAQQQQFQLTAALTGMDSRLTGRLHNSEGQAREDTQKLISNMYQTIVRQRAQDLETINARFESSDAKNAIKTLQTNEILGTLLQAADLTRIIHEGL
jgi:hypothetical protein